MPLRPLRPDGQPKLDKELTKDEIASRIQEEEEDRRLQIARAARSAQENALLESAKRAQRT